MKMSEKICLNLLLCVILWQAIFATIYDKENRVSSDFLVRKRRVINYFPGGRDGPRIEAINYIVRIKENNRGTCAGVILSHYTVLTAASCIQNFLSSLKILSGGANDTQSTRHNVTSSEKYYGIPPYQSVIDGIALLTVDPPFVYTAKTGYINLHQAPIPPGALVTVSGWGCFYPLQPGLEARPKLLSITLPIMDHDECANIYRDNSNNLRTHNPIAITEKHICTYHVRQYCARGDAGAPLIVDNLLAGIHVYKGEYPNRRNPDVYINLQRADYRDWINEHSLLM